MSLALVPVYATPCAADSQLDEQSDTLDGRSDPSDDPSEAVDQQLDELSEALDRQLGGKVDELLTELATAALDQQTGKLAGPRTAQAAAASEGRQPMRCSLLENAVLQCVVVANRFVAMQPGPDASTGFPIAAP